MEYIIIAVGKIKEKYLRDAIDEIKTNINIIEVEDESIKDTAGEKEKNIILKKESTKILSKIKKDEYVIVLHIQGKKIKDGDLYKKIKEVSLTHKKFTFIIGGSLGLHKDVLRRGNYIISFSKMTFPHQLMRLILIEEIKKIPNT